MIKIFIAAILLLPLWLFSQQSITGQVISEKQVPLPGASVFIPNTTIGTLTDANGKFTLANLPAGNTRLIISFVGYETTAVIVNPSNKSQSYIITLPNKVQQLDDIVIRQIDLNGWDNWGQFFKSAFFGTSAYAADCNIINKEVLSFYFNKATKVLSAYASAPLKIENKALGYLVTVTLVDFKYSITNRDVDYLVYSLFEEMKGKTKDMLKWKKNREKVYEFSLMHFIRSLYNNTTTEEGFEMRRLAKRRNLERARVQNIYTKGFQQVKDSFNNSGLDETVTQKTIERSFSRDTLVYYRKILEQDESPVRLQEKLVDDKLIVYKTDSNKATLYFQDYLIVTYKKNKEPEEYYNYRQSGGYAVGLDGQPANSSKKEWPITRMILQQAIPIEISSNGYFVNVDLFIDGFWGWWEKLATKLPYGYEP